MLKVLFTASECAPMIKVGGLGDVIGSLPKALSAIGVNAAVIVPRYEIINPRQLKKVAAGKVFFKNNLEVINVYKSFLPKTTVPIFYVENNRYLSKGGPIYFSKTAIASESAEFDRFHFFSHAIYALLASRQLPFEPEIVHAHDWHTGVLIELLKISPLQIPTVFSIHNLGNQGNYRGRNSIAEGIRHARQVTTVSPTYAKEIQTKEYGLGLENLLRRQKPLGILNGIDYEILKEKFNKGTAKVRLQKESGLRQDENSPLFGLISRLVEQKGIHLITPLVKNFIKKYDAQFAFLGVGEDRYEESLTQLAKKFPENVSANLAFDETLAEKIYIASDFFLMPSLFEPSGLGQMISMHYGTIPIVRSTGGLKDTVQEGKTGLVFSSKTSEDLEKAMKRALKIFDDKKSLDEMRRRCQVQDFSWNRSAKEYKKLYQSLLR